MNPKSQFAVESIRQDFPILQQSVNGHPLIYFDNAATTQKPLAMINKVSEVYLDYNANVHRGVHALSAKATQAYEATRQQVAQFIHACSEREIVFTSGTTAAINLVAYSYGLSHFNSGDEIILSQMEHHANIIPWQLIAKQTGLVIRVAPINEQGEIILEQYKNLFNEKTKFVAVSHVSNALGTINPINEMIAYAHEWQVPVLVDGAQAVPHLSVDVQALDCDFYAFSSHKMYGPTGVGVLYAKAALLEQMPPFLGGGDMIRSVTMQSATFANPPHKFEAGTPNIAGVIAFGASIAYLQQLGLSAITAYEQSLLSYATSRLSTIEGLRIIGQAKDKAAVISFILEGIHAHDAATILDQQGIAVRAGHHCAMPLMKFYQVSATLRASLAFYNTKEEIDQFALALHKVRELMQS